jgi:hypothetical protein
MCIAFCSVLERLCSAVIVNSVIFYSELRVNYMNRSVVIIVAGSLAALILGIAVAYPLLISDFPSLSKVDLSVDVAYAYVEPIESTSNLTGLWWNNSKIDIDHGFKTQANGLVFSYLVVLNVTNLSNEPARIRSFEVVVGPEISVGDSGGAGAKNPVVTDSRDYKVLTLEDEVWSPHTSRLIGLSGVTGVSDFAYPSLNGTVYLYGGVEGQAAYGDLGSYGKAYGLKQVQLQRVENGYLYNILTNENQILLFYHGLEVVVGTRR